MELKNITEVGVAVRDVEKATKLLVDLLGGEAREIVNVETYGMRYRMVRLADIDFELMEPTDENGVIAKFINERGEGLHHIAFAVDDLEEKLTALKEKGCKLIDEKPRDLLGGKVSFVHPRSFFGVMFELIEYPKGHVFPDGSINR